MYRTRRRRFAFTLPDDVRPAAWLFVAPSPSVLPRRFATSFVPRTPATDGRVKRLPPLLMAFATLAAWAAGCSASTTPGIQVAVVLDAPSSPRVTDVSRVIQTNRGFSVALTRGYLSTATIELIACSTTATFWNPFAIHAAYAHTTGSPTRLGVPIVESLIAAAPGRVPVGDLRPPAGAYCRARLTLAPADGDALGLPSDTDMVGKTFLAVGTYARAGQEERPFSMSSAASLDVETAFPSTTLSSDERRTSSLRVTKVADHWFDNIDCEQGDENENVQTVLDNVRRSLAAHLE